MSKVSTKPFLQGLQLADPYYKPRDRTGILLAQQHSILAEMAGTRYSKDHHLKAQNTMFGWAVTGSLPDADSSTVICLKVAAAEEHLDNLLQQFWEQESVPGDQSALSPADQRAMQLISDTTVRDEEGRYYVVHPKKDPVPIPIHSESGVLHPRRF